MDTGCHSSCLHTTLTKDGKKDNQGLLQGWRIDAVLSAKKYIGELLVTLISSPQVTQSFYQEVKLFS